MDLTHIVDDSPKAEGSAQPDGPSCSHTWVPTSDEPPGEKMPGHWRVGVYLGPDYPLTTWVTLLPGMSCPVCGQGLLEKTPPKQRRRQIISEEPTEVYLHRSGTIAKRPCETASVNCVLTCDAARGRKLATVILIAHEVRPEERVIRPDSARIKDGTIVVDWYTKGGDQRRAYSMKAEEARGLAADLLGAADFAETGTLQPARMEEAKK